MSIFRTLPTTIKFNPEEKVQIASAELVSGVFSIAIDVLNTSDTFIDNIEFAVKFKSIDKAYLFNGSEFYFSQDVNVEPFKRYYLHPILLDERFENARAIELYISKYTSGSKTVTLTDKPYSISLPVIPERKHDKIKETLGDEIKTYGENQINFWRCVCGNINNSDVTECHFCGRNKNFVLNNLTEPLINSKILNVIENTKSSSIEHLKRLETHLTQTNLSKIAPNIESIKEDRTNDVKLSKKKFPIKQVFMTLVLISLFTVLSFFLYKNFINYRDKSKIKDAEALIVEGEYKDALEAFDSVSSKNKDRNLSSEIETTKKLLLSDENYKAGLKSYEEKNYLNAAINFKKVIAEDEKNYKDAQEKLLSIEKITILHAEDLVKENKREEALVHLNAFLEVVPGSANATNLKNEIENRISTNIDRDKNSDENYEIKKDENDASELSKRSTALLHNYKKVITEKANLRQEPSTESDIIKILENDTELYILETKIEGTKRIWCYVEVKNDETKENLKGWISDRTLN
ncbi:SH3 domain-containing protein [Peptoniphilus sp. MSJ-1]|uniref:SH3 domain-containing protein n=1 Tax=Peptoniphilus ovalis TaxID=2841503 RepID=A0ABS6FGB3_9FIRM|nr:SH3 domain-containing protein [Peptoniphilus ovalis]MBU5668311.1 SH3 domain-containing protein [Peptoniphilus ovalis]